MYTSIHRPRLHSLHFIIVFPKANKHFRKTIKTIKGPTIQNISMKTMEQTCTVEAKTVQMTASSAKMLQIPFKWCESYGKSEVKNVANTVEIAATRFKMLQIVRKMNGTGNPKEKTTQQKKQKSRPFLNASESHFWETQHAIVLNMTSCWPELEFLKYGTERYGTLLFSSHINIHRGANRFHPCEHSRSKPHML